MDSSAGNARGSTDAGVCELTQIQHRRDSPWPFRYSVLDRGIVVNNLPARKKVEEKEIGEALW